MSASYCWNKVKTDNISNGFNNFPNNGVRIKLVSSPLKPATEAEYADCGSDSAIMDSICFRKSARKILKTIKIDIVVMSLKSLRDFIVLCYGINVRDDFEFILLYDYSQYR